MTTPFSAGPQALGYLYQARYALFALLSDESPEAALVVEGLDDVVVTSDNYIKLDQLKHHVQEVAALTNYSAELWKTIRVWSESLSKGEWKPEEVKLSLVTTAQAKEDTITALLCNGKNRDEAKAYEQMLQVADTSTDQKLLPAFAAFKALRQIQQQRLIGAITVVDGSSNIEDIVTQIKSKLRLSTEKEYRDSLYERLEGWWFDKVVTHLLNNSRQPITQTELDEKIYSLAEQFSRDSLPIDYQDTEPYEEYFIENDNRIFVQQLKHLKINTQRLKFAVLDYYRAFEQRSRWVRENLYIDDELELYESRLKREWSRYIAILEDDFRELNSDEQYVKFGRLVLLWMENANLPIRSKMPMGHEFITRGSYHMLADVNPPSVYWHPKFIESLNEILALK